MKCKHCNGTGLEPSSLGMAEKNQLCTVCGGSGIVKKPAAKAVKAKEVKEPVVKKLRAKKIKVK